MLVRALRDGTLEVVVSPQLLAELDDALRRPRFRRFLTFDEVDELLHELPHALPPGADPEPAAAVLRDKKDDDLVFLARAVGAACIVSGDAALTDALLDPPALTPYRAAEHLGLSWI